MGAHVAKTGITIPVKSDDNLYSMIDTILNSPIILDL